MLFFCVIVACLQAAMLAKAQEPNPPEWPASVSVFSPSMPTGDIAAVVNAAYAVNGGDPMTSCSNGQFSDERFAFMFLPGTYTDLDVPVGYYTSVYGLGAAPTDTMFTGGGKGVYCEQACGPFEHGALDTFWRSAENFHTSTAYPWAVGTGMTWAVSQAAPLRNVKIDNDLLLFEYLDAYCCAAGYASGGWLSGAEVGGKTTFGSQQQFMVRSSSAGTGFDKPVWNGVFAAVNGAPEAQCGEIANGQSANASISVEPSVPLVAEKPYITSTDGSSFQLVVPAVQTETAPGVAWTATGFPDATIIDFSEVYVTKPSDTSTTINAKLMQGLHVVVTPGIYQLESSLVLRHENQVLLGLGLATLIAPSNGDPCVKIGDVSGVRVAGLLLQAGKWETQGAMLQVGETGTFAGSETNPVVLTDVFARVGGPDTGVGPVETMVLIQSGYTIIDNTWLWRADHIAGDALVYNSENPVNHGLVVKADNVYAYGLAAEHTIEDNVLWEGDNGLTYFYQAEIMYDFLEPTWDYSCYTLGADVTTHTGTGLGCYSYFRDASSYAPKGINTNGASSGVNIKKAVSVFLDGVTASGINNVMDADGKAVDYANRVQYQCSDATAADDDTTTPTPEKTAAAASAAAARWSGKAGTKK